MSSYCYHVETRGYNALMKKIFAPRVVNVNLIRKLPIQSDFHLVL